MIERLAFVIVLVVLGVIAYRLLTRHQLGKAAQQPHDPLLQGLPSGIPTIVYFTTPTCAPCRLQQTPTLEHLQREFGDGVRVVRVDATQDTDAAARWGVFSVPTTFILDRDGLPRNVYNGVVDGATLRQALSAV